MLVNLSVFCLFEWAVEKWFASPAACWRPKLGAWWEGSEGLLRQGVQGGAGEAYHHSGTSSLVDLNRIRSDADLDPGSYVHSDPDPAPEPKRIWIILDPAKISRTISKSKLLPLWKCYLLCESKFHSQLILKTVLIYLQMKFSCIKHMNSRFII